MYGGIAFQDVNRVEALAACIEPNVVDCKPWSQILPFLCKLLKMGLSSIRGGLEFNKELQWDDFVA